MVCSVDGNYESLMLKPSSGSNFRKALLVVLITGSIIEIEVSCEKNILVDQVVRRFVSEKETITSHKENM